MYGDIGELFGAITYGIKLNKSYVQGSDGRLGNDQSAWQSFVLVAAGDCSAPNMEVCVGYD